MLFCEVCVCVCVYAQNDTSQFYCGSHSINSMFESLAEWSGAQAGVGKPPKLNSNPGSAAYLVSGLSSLCLRFSICEIRKGVKTLVHKC